MKSKYPTLNVISSYFPAKAQFSDTDEQEVEEIANTKYYLSTGKIQIRDKIIFKGYFRLLC